MEKKATEILNSMIDAIPVGMDEVKGITFVLSGKIYKMLCDELKRNVKTYKKFPVRHYGTIEPDTAYLMPQ